MVLAAFSKRLYMGVRKYWYQGKLNMQFRKQKKVSEMASDSLEASLEASLAPEASLKVPSRSSKHTTPIAARGRRTWF